MPLHLRALGIVSIAALVAACSVLEDRVETSEAAHTEGELIWSNDPFLWADIDRAAFDAEFEKVDGKKPVPATDPVTLRLQAWVDRYDAVVRELVMEKLGQRVVAPKPSVRLMPMHKVNANIWFSPTCLPVFVRLLAAPFRETPDADLRTPTLAGLLGVLATKAKAMDVEALAFAKRLEQNTIGLYTNEQEADEIAMELGARVGLTPDEVIRGFVALSKAIEADSIAAEFVAANNGMTSAQCEALYKSGFKNGDKDVYVALGDLDSPHHAFCYRIFNLYREMAAHHYRTATPSYPAATVPWADLQAHARELLDARSPSQPPQSSEPP